MIDLQQSHYMRTLETAIQFGLPVLIIEGLRQGCLFTGSEGDRLAAVGLHAHPGDGHSVWAACAAAERAGEAGPLT